MISNNFIPRPPTSITTTRSTTSTTTTTTTTTSTTTSTTTTTSASTTTTIKPEPEENNEVIRGRKVNSLVDGLQGHQQQSSAGRGRVKILVRHKKRPPPPGGPNNHPSSAASSELLVEAGAHSSIQRTAASIAEKLPTAKGHNQQLNKRPKSSPVFRRQRVRFMPTQIEVRTEKSVRTATSKSFSLQRPSLFSKRNGLLAAAIISGSNDTVTTTTNTKVAADEAVALGRRNQFHENFSRENNNDFFTKNLLAIRSFCHRPPMEKDDPHCFRPEPLYFYNVTSASCEPFFKGHCARSRNKFESVQTCEERCLVTSSSSTTTSKDSKSQTSATAAKTSSSSASSSTPRPSLFKSRLPRRRGVGLF